MYFLDTFAIIEYLKGNKNYVKLIENSNFSTSAYQLMEVYYIALKEQNEELAEKYFEAFSLARVAIPDNTLKNAMKTRLRFQTEKKSISYVDAIGFEYAKEHNLLFLTGDQAFKHVEGVKWIPAQK